MTALAQSRFTRFRKAGGIDLPVAAGVHIFKGAWCVLESGYLRPAHASSIGINAGRASDEVDNTLGIAGAVTAHVKFLREKTFFPMVTAVTFAQTDVGLDAYLVDDQTVTNTANESGKIPMGVCWWLETNNGVQTAFISVDET
jgi:hypothetical protein